MQLWLIPVFPLAGFLLNGILGRRFSKAVINAVAIGSVLLSFVWVLKTLVGLGELNTAYVERYFTWIASGNFHVGLDFSVDRLTAVMLLVVTGVGSLIHIYSIGYMAHEEGYCRFFAYLNLFMFFMLTLVLGANYLVLFIGWEGVGLCSYLLVGFYFTKKFATDAGNKAFIVNRIGDFGFSLAMFLIVVNFGTLDFGSVFANMAGKSEATLTAIAFLLLLGACGKSAQIPLYVWLPDAMAGPTPVSALIHAATMVTAGIYLICRLSFVFVLSPFTMMTIAIVGALTALFAATIAVVQNDIKKVLAYSTISQLGFMFLGVGVGAFTAGFFHVFTHAFFKACLFLCAGSVIHAMHSRIHDDDKAQDIRNMGGLNKWLPLTHWTFAAATAAIIGLPFTSGFFSKDEILYRAFVDHTVNPEDGQGLLRKLGTYAPPRWLGTALHATAVAAPTLTAFYMCRLYFLTFWGDFKGWTVGRPSLLARHERASAVRVAAADHVDDDEGEADHAHHEDLATPGHAPHESPWQMTVPLIILAAFSLFAR